MNQSYINNIDAIIFDLTGTIINSRQSYLRVIELTVNNYFKSTVVTQGEIRRIKGVIGYNNEWDTSYALVTLIQNKIPLSEWEKEAQKILPIDQNDPLFRKLYNLFQTCYLGSELFKKLENGNPPFEYSPGLITLETSYVDKKLIRDIKKAGYKIAIATGCPYAEAIITLKAQGLIGEDYFTVDTVVSREDTDKLKPDPAPILEAKRRINAINPIYIGDNISDAEASRRANIPCIFLNDQYPAVNPNDTTINQILKMFL